MIWALPMQFTRTLLFSTQTTARPAEDTIPARSTWSQYAEINPVVIVDDEIEYVSDTNFGLNLVLSFYCDLSDVLDQAKRFTYPCIESSIVGHSCRNKQLHRVIHQRMWWLIWHLMSQGLEGSG